MTPFFVGWSGRSAVPMLRFLALILLTLLVGFGALAFALGVAVDDPGGGDFTGDKSITGVLIADPYPMIVTDGDDHTDPVIGRRQARGSGAGARVGRQARACDRRRRSNVATATCCWSISCNRRPVRRRRRSVRLLGSWRLTGEICDGKCSLGVMRPGNKAMHKACANVCLIGGVPPVFITTTRGIGYAVFADGRSAKSRVTRRTARLRCHYDQVGWHIGTDRRCTGVPYRRHQRGLAVMWRSTAMIVLAFVAALSAVVYSPPLLDWMGLGEFVFLGQLGLPIVVLSILERLFRRISGRSGPGFIRYDMV